VLLVITMLGALTQHEFREFGAARDAGEASVPGPVEETAIVGDTAERPA
jgi:hypothetical protein